MIRYLGAGKRDYAAEPIPCVPRGSWEFQAIVKGRAAPLLPRGAQPDPAGSCLWVFPPGHIHGWHSDRRCEVVVFHLANVPEAMVAEYADFGCVELKREEIHDLKKLAARARPETIQPTLRFSSIALQVQGFLSWIALKDVSDQLSGETTSVKAVERSMAWFERRMHEGVGLNEMADQMGISVSHLRRLFHDALGLSPRDAMNKARLTRAESLLRMGSMKQEAIASACGLGSIQAFSRFFRVAHGLAPALWANQASAKAKTART